MMKILHTSDWHLGKKLFKLDRSLEHALFLDWLIKEIQTRDIDLLVIAGDIFDTPTPPHSALEMFYDFLHRASTETSAHVYIIAGNHDSGLLLEAPSKILRPHRVKVWGKLSTNPMDHWVKFSAKNQSIEVCGIPFFRSYELLPNAQGDAIAALTNYLSKETKTPKLLILHHLAGIFEAAGSEQAISLTGLDSIPKELLKDFSYVALGHIHKPQKIADNAYYSGSPIPLRFSETYPKSMLELEYKENDLIINKIELPVFRQLTLLKVDESNWEEKIKKLEKTTELTPMVEVQIELKAPVIGLVDKIRKKIEDKEMELLSYQPQFLGEYKTVEKNDKLFELSTMDLFKEFYKQKYPDAPEVPSDLEDDFKELILRVSDETPQTET